MKYEDSVQRSAELLRKALPLMSRQAAGLHPIAYSLWYEYVAQGNAPLNNAVDQHLARYGTLDEASTEALFRQHVTGGLDDDDWQQRMADTMQRVLGGMAESAAQAGTDTARFGSSLSRLSLALSHDDAAHRDAVAETLAETELMQQTMSALQSRLSDSLQEIDALREEVARVRMEAMVDELTNLANRRAFDQRMASCLAEFAANGDQPPGLLTCDIDHFKKVNDTYGHSFGDQVICAVAELLRSLAPAGAMPARTGGEEFAMLLPAMPLADCEKLAERICRRMRAARIKRQGTQETVAHVTLSLGVTAGRAGESASDFCERADRALYQSKNGGRDRVTSLA